MFYKLYDINNLFSGILKQFDIVSVVEITFTGKNLSKRTISKTSTRKGKINYLKIKITPFIVNFR